MLGCWGLGFRALGFWSLCVQVGASEFGVRSLLGLRPSRVPLRAPLRLGLLKGFNLHPHIHLRAPFRVGFFNVF